MNGIRLASGLLAALLFAPALARADIAVVASIKPIHSLVAGVMRGAGVPTLLVAKGSPHGYQMRPSEARALAEAHAVFWVGERLEGFLVKPLGNLALSAVVVALARAPGVALLPAREGGIWEADEHGADGAWDAHVWLDPGNARAMVLRIAAVLGARDPERAALYERNAGAMTARLDELDARLQDILAPVRDVPFIVFHDAYRYLERRYGLTALGSVVVSPDQPPGPRRLGEIRRRLAGARCVFGEPGQSSRLFAAVVEGSDIGLGELDPEGLGLTPGPELYFELMERLAESVRACLGAG